jgi:hypothetical protein
VGTVFHYILLAMSAKKFGVLISYNSFPSDGKKIKSKTSTYIQRLPTNECTHKKRGKQVLFPAYSIWKEGKRRSRREVNSMREERRIHDIRICFYCE